MRNAYIMARSRNSRAGKKAPRLRRSFMSASRDLGNTRSTRPRKIYRDQARSGHSETVQQISSPTGPVKR
jgi:hypothetical protein